jgi:hypothetical protein
MKKNLLLIIIVLIAVGAGAFYGGIKYAKSKNPQSDFARGNFQNFRDLSPEERQSALQKSGVDLSARGGNRTRAGMISGEIIAKDEQSVTVKMPDGGSKIIFFSESTEITKSVGGSANDLAKGGQITINGQENDDGSYAAKTIQLRPLDRPQ